MRALSYVLRLREFESCYFLYADRVLVLDTDPNKFTLLLEHQLTMLPVRVLFVPNVIYVHVLHTGLFAADRVTFSVFRVTFSVPSGVAPAMESGFDVLMVELTSDEIDPTMFVLPHALDIEVCWHVARHIVVEPALSVL